MLPPSCSEYRGKWMPRAIALLHYSIQTVLAPSPNPTWALGSAAQLSLFLALHCIITRSSLHSLPRLCTTPLHCSITRNLFSQLFFLQPSGRSITACTALSTSPVVQQLRSLPGLPHLCSRAQFLYSSTAEIFWFCHLPPALWGIAQPCSIKPPCFLPCSALSIQYQAATLLKHPLAFFNHLSCSWVHTRGVTRIPLLPQYAPHAQPVPALQSHNIHLPLHHLSIAL